MQRRWFQIHLATALVMMLVAGVGLPSVLSSVDLTPGPPSTDEAWNTSGALSTFAGSTQAAPSGYTFSLLPRESGFEHELIIRNADGTEVLRLSDIRSFDRTPFVIQNDVLYLPRYSSIASGCTVVAIDLKTRKELWNARLYGLGTIAHSKYSNQISIREQNERLYLYGFESSGKYVEILRLADGACEGSRSQLNRGGPPTWKDALIPLAILLAITLAVGALFEFILRYHAARRT